MEWTEQPSPGVDPEELQAGLEVVQPLTLTLTLIVSDHQQRQRDVAPRVETSASGCQKQDRC